MHLSKIVGMESWITIEASTIQILYLPTSPVGVPDIFDIKRIILVEIGKLFVPFVLCDVIFVA